MTYRLAIGILRDLPKCWSMDSKSLKSEYAKQLLEKGLIEEVESGKYRLTQDGTFYSEDIWLDKTRYDELKRDVMFILEEIDITPHLLSVEKYIAEHCNKPFVLDEYRSRILGKPATY